MKKFLSSLLLVLLLVGASAPDLVYSQRNSHRGSRTAAAGASDFVTDSFTMAGSSNVDLSTHTGELGATWTHHPHANYTTPFNLDQANGVIWAGGTSAYYASGTPPSADYYVQGTVKVTTAISVNIAVAGRMDTTADTMYLCRYNNTSWDLRKIVAATASTLATTSANLLTAGQSGTIKLIMTGNQISCIANGTTLGPITDSSITAAGKAGVRNAGASSQSTGFQLDNFSAR